MLSISKHPFEMSNLSKHLIKNLQTTINVLTDQEENEKVNTKEVSNMNNQKKLVEHSFPEESSKPNKGKGKDTGDQSSRKKIPPINSGGDDDDSSSNSEEESDQRRP